MSSNKISTILVKIDYISDLIPVVSSATNLIDLFLKCAIIPCLKKSQIETSHYWTHLNKKSFAICLSAIFLPVIANTYLAIKYYKDGQKKSLSHKKIDKVAIRERTDHSERRRVPNLSLKGDLGLKRGKSSDKKTPKKKASVRHSSLTNPSSPLPPLAPPPSRASSNDSTHRAASDLLPEGQIVPPFATDQQMTLDTRLQSPAASTTRSPAASPTPRGAPSPLPAISPVGPVAGHGEREASSSGRSQEPQDFALTPTRLDQAATDALPQQSPAAPPTRSPAASPTPRGAPSPLPAISPVASETADGEEDLSRLETQHPTSATLLADVAGFHDPALSPLSQAPSPRVSPRADNGSTVATTAGQVDNAALNRLSNLSREGTTHDSSISQVEDPRWEQDQGADLEGPHREHLAEGGLTRHITPLNVATAVGLGLLAVPTAGPAAAALGGLALARTTWNVGRRLLF
ncbi:MAG: hypothetical protein FJZ59_05175 [Chlamydiae bacterium]|nr:hypothetical protein [Chlamydiota bacterium]